MFEARTRRKQANRMHEEGVALSEAGDKAGALAKYRAALELDFDRPSTLYNVGLIYKYQSAWQESFRFNERAYELRPDDEATAWNLAIAATALRGLGHRPVGLELPGDEDHARRYLHRG